MLRIKAAGEGAALSMFGKDKKDKGAYGGNAAAAPQAEGGGAAPQEALRPAQKLPVVIHAQYMKDLSFENPNAPHSLRPAKDTKPTMDINFSMDAKKTDALGKDADNAYEVTLGVRATANKDNMVAFIVEVEYGVIVTLEGVPEEKMHPMLLIEMPRYVFPFIRQMIASVTQQGGFAPLLLAPVDFRSFYLQRYGADAPAEAESAA